MALDIHWGDSRREYLYSIDDEEFNSLDEIFELFFNQSGIRIQAYDDCRLSVSQQQHLVRIIDNYATRTDLNRDKTKTMHVLGFRGLLLVTIGQDRDIQLYGD